MEPQIKYALTEDGASIAYWTLGEGTPFIWPHGAAGSSSLRAWRTPEGRPFFERLAARRMIVRYDARGFGNSQAGTVDFSLGARVRDLAAVVDRLGADTVDLCAYLDSGPGVLAYAAAHPQRVSHLVLWGTGTRGLEILTPAVNTLMTELAKLDFELWREAMIVAVMRAMGVGRDEREYARTLIEMMTPQTAEGFAAADTLPADLDVKHLLPEIRPPALILHRRALVRPAIGDVQTMATRIPNARLVLLEGDAAVPYMGDVEPVLAAIDEFLSGDAVSVQQVRQPPGGLVAVLFTDIVGHTAMMQRLGDTNGRAVLRDHERITRDTLRTHGGAEVKTDGDSFMATFTSPSAALDCAVALQRAFAHHAEAGGEPIVVRMGLNVGEPIEEDGDFFGSSVILASRIKDRAGGGEILVPEAVRHMLSGKSYVYADRGQTTLKGFEDPVRLYEVRWRE